MHHLSFSLKCAEDVSLKVPLSVPLLWSLPDYGILLSVLVFHLSLVWDLPRLHLILSPLPAEFDVPSRLDYKPFSE